MMKSKIEEQVAIEKEHRFSEPSEINYSYFALRIFSNNKYKYAAILVGYRWIGKMTMEWAYIPCHVKDKFDDTKGKELLLNRFKQGDARIIHKRYPSEDLVTPDGYLTKAKQYGQARDAIYYALSDIVEDSQNNFARFLSCRIQTPVSLIWDTSSNIRKLHGV